MIGNGLRQNLPRGKSQVLCTDYQEIDSQLFEEWFEGHFLRHAPPQRSLLLLLDGYSSHYQPAVVRKAATSEVILFCLPPHVTHLAQPLDKTVFSPLKTTWHEECQLYTINNPGRVVTRFNFMSLFSKAWLKAMDPSNIISGFRSTGIYPLDRNAIHVPALDEESEDQESLATSSGLAYIPLYSPVPRRHSMRSKSCMEFTEADLWRFQERYENQYDCIHDQQYNKWLYIHHPEEALQQTTLIFSSDDNSSLELQSEGTDYETSQGQTSKEPSAQPSLEQSSKEPSVQPSLEQSYKEPSTQPCILRLTGRKRAKW